MHGVTLQEVTKRVKPLCKRCISYQFLNPEAPAHKHLLRVVVFELDGKPSKIEGQIQLIPVRSKWRHKGKQEGPSQRRDRWKIDSWPEETTRRVLRAVDTCI